MQMGIHRSLHRDVIGPSFQPHLIELRFQDDADFRLPSEAADTIRYGAPRNRFHVQTEWIDQRLELGNPLTFKQSPNLR